jgi:hypothetical protein
MQTGTRRRLRAAVRTGLAVVVALVALAFPFGPLFPWSPWKPGYQHLAFARADLYYPAGTMPPRAFLLLDQDIAEAEAFHGYTAPSRIRVIFCRNWGDVHRFLPHLWGRAIGGAALETGTVIYISPRVAERGFDHREFVRHELSHTVLHQNQGLLYAFRTSHAESFFEGLAVSFGRQKAFVSTTEALDWIRVHDVKPVFDPGERESGRARNMRLNYTVWRLFVDYLRDVGGQATFARLLGETMKDPDGYATHVASAYGATLPSMLGRFQEAVQKGTWSARN